MACFLGMWSLSSLKDLRFSGEIAGGGIVRLNIASAARRHWFMLRPLGSCINIQSAWTSCCFTKFTKRPTSKSLALIISARTKRFSTSVKGDSMVRVGFATLSEKRR